MTIKDLVEAGDLIPCFCGKEQSKNTPKKSITKKNVLKKKASVKKVAKKKAAKKKVANPMKGMKFAITGKLSSIGRAEAKGIIEDNGGKVVASISKNIDYLLSGEKTGTKLDKAKALGIKVITETEFLVRCYRLNINPLPVKAISAEKARLLREHGVNRISMGVSADAKTKKTVKKKAPAKKKAVKKVAKKTANPIDGMAFVITGKLPLMGRAEATEIIKDNGGKVGASISKNTDYLLSGEKTGTKLDKAKALGVKVITEQKLLKMLPQ